MSGIRRVAMLLGVVLLPAACAPADEEPAAGSADTTAAVTAPGTADNAAAAGATAGIDAVLSEWQVTLSQDSVPGGPITIGVSNEGTMAHAFEIEGNGEEFATDAIAVGDSVTMSVDLAPGEYKVYCPIDSAGVNHEAQGMVTRLRVY